MSKYGNTVTVIITVDKIARKQFTCTVDSNCNEFVAKRAEYNGETGRIGAGFDSVVMERERMKEQNAKIGIK